MGISIQHSMPFYLGCIDYKRFEYPPLKEEELQEQLTKGSGPGGQSVNKTTNCVVLKHIPTGVVVKCHETRSLETNRERARERLQHRLDMFYNGEESMEATERREMTHLRKAKKARTNKRLEKLKAFKDREGLS